ncbi:unnamed protein product [Adineta ricciae]|uniref:Uncharacterized protein n=1 Tax=Adineta ricciae TaxID=249248 RepID=A0A815I3J9_ADIRI|nr:unnamed protein product [Adineta ricciae]
MHKTGGAGRARKNHCPADLCTVRAYNIKLSHIQLQFKYMDTNSADMVLETVRDYHRNGPDYTPAAFTSIRRTTGKPATPPPPPTCPRDLSPISQSHLLQKIGGSSSSNIYRHYKYELETQYQGRIFDGNRCYVTQLKSYEGTHSFASSDFGSPSHDYLTQIMNVKGATSYVIEFYLAFVGNADSTIVMLDTR